MTTIALLSCGNTLAPFAGYRQAVLGKRNPNLFLSSRGSLLPKLQAFYYHHRTNITKPPASFMEQSHALFTCHLLNSHLRYWNIINRSR